MEGEPARDVGTSGALVSAMIGADVRRAEAAASALRRPELAHGLELCPGRSLVPQVPSRLLA